MEIDPQSPGLERLPTHHTFGCGTLTHCLAGTRQQEFSSLCMPAPVLWCAKHCGVLQKTSVTWPNGLELTGMSSLRDLLLDYDEQFVRTVTEKLMSYALGRPLEYFDQPTVRQIVRDAKDNDYRWSSIVLGIVKSPAFLMRRSLEAA